MTFDEMVEALDEAKRIQRLADIMADRMAKNVVGRLRRVDHYTLKKLKSELQSYNIQTRTWKEGA